MKVYIIPSAPIPSQSLTVCPWKLTFPNRKGSSSNHHFSGAMLNFGVHPFHNVDSNCLEINQWAEATIVWWFSFPDAEQIRIANWKHAQYFGRTINNQTTNSVWNVSKPPSLILTCWININCNQVSTKACLGQKTSYETSMGHWNDLWPLKLPEIDV